MAIAIKTATENALIAYIADRMGALGTHLDVDLPSTLRYKTVGLGKGLLLEDVRAGAVCRVWADQDVTNTVLIGGAAQIEQYTVTVAGCGIPQTSYAQAVADAALLADVLKLSLRQFPMSDIITSFTPPRKIVPIMLFSVSVTFDTATTGTESREYVTTFSQTLTLRTQVAT